MIADSVLAVLRDACEFSKPLVAGSWSAGNGDLGVGNLHRRSLLDGVGIPWAAWLAREGILVDQQILEPVLDLRHGRVLGSRSHLCNLNRPLLNRTNRARAGLLILNRSLLGRRSGNWGRNRSWVIDNGDLETQLQLRLGGTVELLVDGCVCRVEDNERGRAVGVAFEDGLGGGGDGEEESELLDCLLLALDHNHRECNGNNVRLV